LVLERKRVKKAGLGHKNGKYNQETRRREEGKAATEDLRKGIPLVWRETFENGIPGGKCYSL